MRKIQLIFSILIVALAFGACEYTFIVPEEIPVIDVDDPNARQVSFAQEIQPIFTNDCVACHNGLTSPNLSEGNSFAAIAGYINSTDPELSEIVTKPSPTASGTHKKYTAAQAALVLGWIKQGAKNN